MKTYLIVAAHPDDEVLGCFGTAARLIQEGNKVCTLILGEGTTTRDVNISSEDSVKEIENANNSIGIHQTFIGSLPDNKFDSVDFIDIVKVIEKVIKEVQPQVIFTHYENDLNIDHQLTHQAVLTAARPMQGSFVKEIYSFEVLSSTEWNFPQTFSPTVFYDITDTISSKINAMKCYDSELRDFPHPRSIEGIILNASYRGMNVGRPKVEAFECVYYIL